MAEGGGRRDPDQCHSVPALCPAPRTSAAPAGSSFLRPAPAGARVRAEVPAVAEDTSQGFADGKKINLALLGPPPYGHTKGRKTLQQPQASKNCINNQVQTASPQEKKPQPRSPPLKFLGFGDLAASPVHRDSLQGLNLAPKSPRGLAIFPQIGWHRKAASGGLFSVRQHMGLFK